jgi:hypothetical protein
LDFTLVEGERPGRLLGCAASAVLSALILVLFGTVQLRRNVVFQRMAPGPPVALPSIPSERGIAARVSGRFMLERKTGPRFKRVLNALLSGAPRSRWFLDSPATLAVRGPGELAFITFADPSLRLFGVVRLEDRSGIWSLAFESASVPDPEYGRMYLGLVQRPALRFRYFESPSGRGRQTVLSFAGEGDCEAFRSRLGEAVGREIRPN